MKRSELILLRPAVSPLSDIFACSSLDFLHELDELLNLPRDALEHGMVEEREAFFVLLLHDQERAAFDVNFKHFILFRLKLSKEERPIE